jgi:hypothetical protein
MNNSNKITGLSGLAVLTFKGGDSPLCVGEVTTHKPFEALKGFERGMGIPVSDKKLDGICWRKRDVNHTQKFTSATVTLLKNVNNDCFQTKLTPQVVEFVTGKKSVWKGKGNELPKLTFVEIVQCTMAEFALDKFHTLNGLELKCSFYEGGEVVWSSKY